MKDKEDYKSYSQKHSHVHTHSHSHSHHHHTPSGSKNILIAFALNFSFAIIELFGGYFTNSIAIYSDALHDFGDSLALLFAYFSEKISQKEADKKYTFGYRRFSVLSAFINGVILLLGSCYVLYEAILRIYNPQVVKPEGMLGLAILGILVNSYAAYKLSKDTGMNQKMVSMHLLEDILGWVAVFIVSIVLMFKPIYVLDSILSILISIIIFKGVYGNMKKIGAIFLQRFPSELKIHMIEDEIKENNMVCDVHALKGWSIDEENHYLSFHVSVPGKTIIDDIDLLKIKIKHILAKHDIKFSTIEFESDSIDCVLNEFITPSKEIKC